MSLLATSSVSIINVDDGQAYALQPSNSVIIMNEDGDYKPSQLSFQSVKLKGTDNPSSYSGRFKIEKTSDETNWTTEYTSSSDESSTTYNMPSKIEDKTPYVFRPTGNGKDVGNKAFTKIIGGTIAWNQLVRDEASPNETDFADVVTVTDAVEDVAGVKVKLEPIQDLHGYDHPWPAGGGVNKVQLSEAFTNLNVAYGLTCSVDGEKLKISGTFTGSYSSASFRVGALNKNKWTFDGFHVKGFILSGVSSSQFGGFRYGESTKDSLAIDLRSLTNGETYTMLFDIVFYEGDTAPTAWSPYSNICPISGVTSAKVTRAGKNLLNLLESEIYSSGYNRWFPFKIKAGTYTMSCQNKMYISGELKSARISVADANRKSIKSISTSYGYGNAFMSFSFTITEDESKAIEFIMFEPIVAGITFAEIAAMNNMVELGSTATAYEPYSGNTYDITFPTEAGTVYGGTLDVTQGVLTVDRAMVTLDGSSDESWGEYGGGSDHYCCVIYQSGKAIGYQKSICNEFKNVNNAFGSADYGIYSDHPSLINTYFRMPNADVNTKSEFLAWIAQHPIQLVYYLAEPFTVTLSAEQLNTLYGTNNIWSDAGDLALTYTGTDEYFTLTDGHKYLTRINGTDSMVIGTGQAVTAVKGRDNIFDLTQMFGMAVTDYVYGQGASYFRKLFPKPLYQHDAGSLKSVEGLQSHETVGKNLLDVADDDNATTNAASALLSSAVLGVKFVEGKQYTFSIYTKALEGSTTAKVWYARFRYSDGTLDSYGKAQINDNRTASGQVMTRYTNISEPGKTVIGMQFTQGTNYGISYKDIQLELGSAATEYEPYVKHSYPLDSTLTLRGIPKLDAQDNLYYDGDEYLSDGTVTRKYLELKFGTDITASVNTWYSADENKNTWGFYYNYNSSGAAAFPYNIKPGQIVSDKFLKVSSAYAADEPYVMSAVYTTGTRGYLAFRIPKTAIDTPTDATDLSAKINAWVIAHPFTVVAESNIATTETAEPYQKSQVVDAYGTEEFVTTGIVPVGHETEYAQNISSIRCSLYASGGTTTLLDQQIIPIVNDAESAVYMTKQIEEYRLSDSSTSITGSGDGYDWAGTMPTVPPGKYLWKRLKSYFSNGSIAYSDAVCDVVTSGLVFDVDRNSNAITSKVWESDITSKINQYDGSTGATIRDRVTQTETNITGITSRVSDVESETDSLGTRMTSAESNITQNANNIATKVSKDGVISSINQSAETVKISASKVNIEGAVTFSSFDSALQNRLTTAESDASTAKSNASSAVSTANTASSNASSALTKVNNSIKSTTMHYLATSASSGVTTSTSGWTTTIQSITKDKPYLWTYQTITKINDTTSNTDPVISGVYGATGGKGDTGTGVTKVEQLYRTSNSTTAPAAPTSAVSSTSTSYNTWTLAMPTYNTSYPYYYICTQTTYDNGTVKWTTVSRSKALEDANSTANTANTNASNAVSTANTANTNASNAVSTANTANTNASNAVTTANQAKSKADSAASLLGTWTGDATLATTTINGGYIKTHTIESTHLATDAIMSSNYQASSDASSPYSATGAFLDLSTGNLYMPNFGVNGTTGAAYFNGTVNANAGKFGDDTSYWNIETVYDYNMQPHAALVGTGSPYLQTGNWQVSDNAVSTRKYTSTSESSGNATYYKDSGTNTFYDVGMKIPTNFGGYSTSDSSVTKYNKAFYYGRKYTGNNAPSLDSDWTYFFSIDSGGNVITAGDVYEGGVKLSDKYAAITDVGSAYLPKTGGTITGNLSVNGSFTTNLMLQTNLGSTSSAQLTGSANAVVKPGVTGTLGVGNGGTGKTTALDAANAFITALPTWTATPTDNTYFIRRDTGGTATYGQVKFSTLWTYIDNKITSAYDITNTYRRLDDNQFDTINITDAQVGNLMVTGAGRFTNGLYGDLIGNADTATTATTADKVGSNLVILLNSGTTEGTNKFTYNGSATKNVNITKSGIGLGNVDNTADANKTVKEAGKVTNTLKIQLNGGTTEGTNQFSYDGSAVKNINITKSSVGLGNVENTALSTWTGSANLTTTKVGTLAAAATKGVDTSISAASTSANLPTSAAVATFVEGKGYVTSSGVTSVRVQATSPVVSSVNTAQSSTLNTTISLADGYGDTKNPYGTKTKNYVLAGPTTGSAVAPTFRALVADDIPTLTPGKAGLGNVTNNKQVKGLSSGTTSGHLVSWGADGYTVADSGVAVSSVNKMVKSLASNNDGKIVLTYLDGTTSDPIEVKIIGSSGSSVSYADALNVNGTAVGGAEQPVFINNQGKPQTANKIPKLNNGTTGGIFYAPTGAGTSGQFLKSSGSGAPTWETISKSTVGLGNVANLDQSKAIKSITKSGGTYTATALDGTTSTFSESVTGVKGSEESTYRIGNVSLTAHNVGAIAYNDTIFQTNCFASEIYRKLYMSKIDNAFFALDKRYTVTATNDGVAVTNVAQFFDGSYEGNITHIEDGKTAVITINFGTKFDGYPYGYIYVSFYNYCIPSSITARVYNTYESQGVGWHNLTFEKYDNSIFKSEHQGYYGMQILEITIVGSSDTPYGYTSPTEIEFQPTRPEPYAHNPMVTKFGPQTLYYDITAPNFIGNLNGTATKATQDGDGAVISSTYAKLSGATFTGAVNTANGTWNTIGDDAYLGDINKGGHIGIKGKNGNTGLFFVTYNQNSNTTGGAITWDGTKFSISGTVDTSISGNATTATIATTANSIENLGRKANLDIDNTDNQYKNKVTYMLASSSTTTGKPPIDGGVLNFAWDGNRWGAQLAIKIDTTPHMYIRGNNNSDWDASWLTILDSNNFNTYAPKKDGTGATGTWGISISGSATKATQDSDGHAINTTYAKLSGATFTGAVTGTSFAASDYISANDGSGTAGGVNLYSRSDSMEYAIMFRSTYNQVKHGFVQSDWATYLTMGGNASNIGTRGWIFKDHVNSKGVASISGAGNMALNGELAIGTTGTNISGSCSLVMDRNLSCLNFVFN